MKVLRRELTLPLIQASRAFPALVVTGPRRAGKTFCLRHTFPQASYHLLEHPDVLARLRQDPRGWLEEIQLPAILDEVQNAPEVFPYIRALIDESPRKMGQWLLTGSQDFALMSGVSESMAGRAAVFQLLPFSFRELGRWDLLRGGFPEVWAHPKQRTTWFSSYLQTYLERDVRALLALRDLATFRRFLGLLAVRGAQTLNRNDLASPLGVSVPTISHWIGVLETTGVLTLVPPYFENFEKRLIKSPKIFWLDTGLMCALLNIRSLADLEASPFMGAVFESFVVAEIAKNQTNAGRAREIYFFRDQQGLEIDLLVPSQGGMLDLIEVKWSRTLTPAMAGPIRRLLPAIKSRQTRATVVYRGPKSGSAHDTTLGDGVLGRTVESFLHAGEIG